MTLAAQIKEIIQDYCGHLDNQVITIEEVGAALISGIALTCEIIIKNDGSQVVNAYSIHKAIKELVGVLDLEKVKRKENAHSTRHKNRKRKTGG